MAQDHGSSGGSGGGSGAAPAGSGTGGGEPGSSGQRDMLDDQGELAYQEAVNGILNTYNPQIAGLQSQIGQLEGQKGQCAAQAREQIANAQGQVDAAKMQQMLQMVEPGANTAGLLLDSLLGGAGDEKTELTTRLNNTVARCNSTPGLSCSSSGVSGTTTTHCDKYLETNGGDKSSSMLMLDRCEQRVRDEARSYEKEIASLNKELKEVGSANDELLSAGMQLAAHGLTGNMMKDMGKKNAERQIQSAIAGKAACEQNINAQIGAVQSQIAQLQQQKARDLMMARMAAEYSTRNRRKAADLNANQNIDEEDNTPIAIAPGDGSGFGSDPIVTATPDMPASTLGSGGGGGGSAGGGGDAGPAGWDFGKGGKGFAGGNTLPPQTAAGSYEGGGGGGGGFGIISGGDSPSDGGFGSGADFGAEGEGEDANRELASVPTGAGDGGLRVMLARSTMIHMKHAPTLMKSLDFDKLAKEAEENGRNAASVTKGLE